MMSISAEYMREKIMIGKNITFYFKSKKHEQNVHYIPNIFH